MLDTSRTFLGKSPVSYWFISVIFSLFVLAHPPQARSDTGKPIPVVNIKNQNKTISLGSLRTMFGMRMLSWPDGTPATVVVLADNHRLHIEFCKQVLGIFPHQLRWAWDRQVYSGTGQAPRQVSTEDQMLHILESTPGAIGYLSRVPKGGKVRQIRVQ